MSKLRVAVREEGAKRILRRRSQSRKQRRSHVATPIVALNTLLSCTRPSPRPSWPRTFFYSRVNDRQVPRIRVWPIDFVQVSPGRRLISPPWRGPGRPGNGREKGSTGGRYFSRGSVVPVRRGEAFFVRRPLTRITVASAARLKR